MSNTANRVGSGHQKCAKIPCNILLLVFTLVLSFKWDQLGHAVCARVTNANMLADLRQILVEEWDAIPQQCVTRLVTSMRRRCQAVVAAYGSSTRY